MLQVGRQVTSEKGQADEKADLLIQVTQQAEKPQSGVLIQVISEKPHADKAAKTDVQQKQTEEPSVPDKAQQGQKVAANQKKAAKHNNTAAAGEESTNTKKKKKVAQKAVPEKKKPGANQQKAASPKKVAGHDDEKEAKGKAHALLETDPEKVSLTKKKSKSKEHNEVQTVEGLIAQIGGVIVKSHGLTEYVESLPKDPKDRPPAGKIVHDLRVAASNTDGWLRLPAPEKGPLLWNMIRSDPWNCDFVPETDRRSLTCRMSPEDPSLNPHHLTCSQGQSDGCGIEHANSFRTLFSIGAMPCCTTPPFCAAPACAEHKISKKKTATCTKRKAEDNVAYLKHPDSWPAYHGWGGAFELDTLKFMDALACGGNTNCSERPFDLVLDLGANTGYYTEKLTVRNFGKNYIMIEANPTTARMLDERWGTDGWRQAWFEQQVPKTLEKTPEFEIIVKPLSNHSGSIIDMCQTESSLEDTAVGCNVPVGAVDDIVPQNLSDTFQEHFQNAQSAFIKIDTEGMDELVLRGMRRLLNETRGKYADKKPKHLVNFLQFEYAPILMEKAKVREGFHEYDIKTVTKFLESMGFESFLMGPRYLPMSHGSWSDDFKTWTEDPSNNAGTRLNYPSFQDTVCWWCQTMDKPSFTSDVFAIRSSHPRAAEIKVALGACQESKDFDIKDAQYSFE